MKPVADTVKTKQRSALTVMINGTPYTLWAGDSVYCLAMDVSGDPSGTDYRRAHEGPNFRADDAEQSARVDVIDP